VDRISLRDESALTWYFLWGRRAFERSTHGAMVERLERDSMGSTRCRVCDGIGILEDEAALERHRQRKRTTERIVRWRLVERDGVVTDEQVSEWHAVGVGSECQLCQGTGWTAKKRIKPRCPECWGKGRAARAQCSACLGTGWLTPNVHSTCGNHEEGGVEVEGDTLRNYATTSRALARLDSMAQRTLERYYGVHGQSWANTAHGRIHGLLEFTPAGKRLIKRTRISGDEATEATAAERLAAQADLQKQDPTTWRRELLEEAARQARVALHTAAQAWLAAKGGQGPADDYDALLDAVDATGDAYEAWLDRNPDCWGDGGAA
jgi:hypothetical protein